MSVPMMALLLVLGPMLLPEFRDPDAGRLDLLSAILSLTTLLGVIYGLKQIAAHGVQLVPALSIGAGAMLGAAFVRRQRKLADPLIDLRLFRAPGFASLVTYMLATFVVFGAYVFIAQFLQLVLGLSPLKAGLWLVPFASGFVVGSTLSPLIARRVRPALLMGVGLVIAAAAFTGLARVDGTSGLAIIVASSVVLSLGLSPVFTLANDMIIGTAPPERAGAAAAISETCSELGGALGIAILGSIGTAIYRGAMAGSGAALLEMARKAFTSGLQVTAITSALVVIGVAVLVTVSLRCVRPATEQSSALPLSPACEDSRGRIPGLVANGRVAASNEPGTRAWPDPEGTD